MSTPPRRPYRYHDAAQPAPPGLKVLVPGRMRLAVQCSRCQRAVLIRPDRAVAVLGGEATFRQAARRLLCSTCGARNGGGSWPIDARPNWPDNYDQIAARGRGVGYTRDEAKLGPHDAGWPPVTVCRPGTAAEASLRANKSP